MFWKHGNDYHVSETFFKHSHFVRHVAVASSRRPSWPRWQSLRFVGHRRWSSWFVACRPVVSGRAQLGLCLGLAAVVRPCLGRMARFLAAGRNQQFACRGALLRAEQPLERLGPLSGLRGTPTGTCLFLKLVTHRATLVFTKRGCERQSRPLSSLRRRGWPSRSFASLHCESESRSVNDSFSERVQSLSATRSMVFKANGGQARE